MSVVAKAHLFDSREHVWGGWNSGDRAGAAVHVAGGRRVEDDGRGSHVHVFHSRNWGCGCGCRGVSLDGIAVPGATIASDKVAFTPRF